jgi:hypothetical protein
MMAPSLQRCTSSGPSVGEAATRVSARRRILAIRRFWIVVLGRGRECSVLISEQLLLAIGQEATLAASAGGFCWAAGALYLYFPLLVPGMPPFVASSR